MNNQLKDDFEFVKTLAQEGHDTPLVSGAYYLLWGGLMGLAAFLSYADDIQLVNLGRYAGVWPWVTAISAGWIISFLMGPKTGAKPGASTLGNKTARAVWFSVGIFTSLFWVTLMFVHDDFSALGVPDYFLFGLMFPLAFGAFGVAFYSTATASRTPWLRWFGFAAWGFSSVSLAMMANPHHMLICSIGVLVCAALPGYLLMRNEAAEIV